MGIFRRTDSGAERRVTYLVSTPYRQPDDPSELPAGATGWGVVPYPGVDPLKTVHDLFGMIEGYDPGARVVGAHMSSAGAAAMDELVRLEYIARADERSFTLIPPDCYPEKTRHSYDMGDVHGVFQTADPNCAVLCFGDASVASRMGVPHSILQTTFGPQPDTFERTELPPGQVLRYELPINL